MINKLMATRELATDHDIATPTIGHQCGAQIDIRSDDRRQAFCRGIDRRPSNGSTALALDQRHNRRPVPRAPSAAAPYRFRFSYPAGRTCRFPQLAANVCFVSFNGSLQQSG
jgi:hypothetical protein